MLKLTLKDKKGESQTIDLKEHLPKIFEKFHECGITASPYNYKIKDTRQDDARVKICSDSDMGNGAIKLLQDNDTIYDAYMLEKGLENVSEDIQDDIERNIINEQYRNTDELFDSVKRMTKELASEKVSFFCPLEGNLAESDGSFGDVGNYMLLDNKYEIQRKLQEEQSPELNMAEHVGNHAKLDGKLIFAEWLVEEKNGKLYGKIDCYLTEKLTEEETNRLKSAIEGQNSDGFGEGFEQRDIPVSEGTLYVSFWNYDSDYFIYTEDEMNEYLSQQTDIKFGGM